MRWLEPVLDGVFDQRCQDMEAAEQGGEFAGLLKAPPPDVQSAPKLPDRTSLLELIKPDMKLYKSTFKRIYGYELSYPGFAEEALRKLEKAGCSRAREYYASFVTDYEREHEKEMVKVAEWYRKQIRERGESLRKRQQETEQRKLSREEVAREFLKW